MNNIKYLKYLLKHKYYVTKECFKQGIYWRGLVHDLSKFTPKEWIAYRNYFYGTQSDIVDKAFDYAWLSHQQKNKHHWQAWILREDSGGTKVMEIPIQYATEMVCDWIGAGIAITGKREANVWYENNKDRMLLHPATRAFVETLLVKAFK